MYLCSRHSSWLVASDITQDVFTLHMFGQTKALEYTARTSVSSVISISRVITFSLQAARKQHEAIQMTYHQSIKSLIQKNHQNIEVSNRTCYGNPG